MTIHVHWTSVWQINPLGSWFFYGRKCCERKMATEKGKVDQALLCLLSDACQSFSILQSLLVVVQVIGA